MSVLVARGALRLAVRDMTVGYTGTLCTRTGCNRDAHGYLYCGYTCNVLAHARESTHRLLHIAELRNKRTWVPLALCTLVEMAEQVKDRVSRALR